MEDGSFEVTTEELLDEMGEDFRRILDEISFDEAVEVYMMMREAEWSRTFSILKDLLGGR